MDHASVDERVYTLQEVEALTGDKAGTLRQRLNRGQMAGVKDDRGNWLIPESALRAPGEYPELRDRWLQEQASGYHTGKPIGARGVQANEYGLLKFWEYLRYIPKADRPEDYKIPEGPLKDVTPANLRLALSTVPVDYKNKNCHFSLRDQMYKGFCSFLHFLIRNRLRAASDIQEAQKLKPKRVFPPRKTVARLDDLEKLLRINDGLTGQSEYDISLTRTLVMLAGMAGLRRAEILNLQVDHIDLKRRELMVIDGKGHKDRVVGLTPELVRQIKDWLTYRAKVKIPNLLVSKFGTPIDHRNASRRLENIARKAEIDVTLHGLRRSFATINIEKGMPVPVAQMLLGHTDVKTTMGYVLIDQKTAVDWLKAPGGRDPAAPRGRTRSSGSPTRRRDP